MLKRLVFVVVLFCLVLVASSDAMARIGGPNVRHSPSSAVPFTSGSPAPQPMTATPQMQQAAPVIQGHVAEYVLGVGDRVRLTVFGETDLSGDYDISSTGKIALPLIGSVIAAGQPIRLFEQAVRQQLADGYLRDPRVSAQVINYRPFFILGEVAKPGSYPYVNGMTIINAVALAGGYTYRADSGDIRLKHAKDVSKKEVRVPEEAIVMPGDIIRVPERFF